MGIRLALEAGAGMDGRMLQNDTIAAVATAPGVGAVALVRVSGPEAIAIASRVFRGREALDSIPARRATLGSVVDGSGARIDEALVTIFKTPASYTGEDVVEIAGHGGILVTQGVLAAVLAAGARAAQPGEFTQRAFLNGKMDLTQAEAVMDLISAQTALAMRAAQEQLEGRLGARINEVRAELLALLAHVEAHIDFPEEGIDPATGETLRSQMAEICNHLRRLLATADQGRILREGVRTVICGAPNAGKSSLLNLLLGFDRAIVSETAGTTRDTIEEVINLRGYPLRLVDTAGLRDTNDAVERQGVARAEQQLARAELILEVVDASQPAGDRVSLPPEVTGLRLLILNKLDLGVHADWEQTPEAAHLSCVTGEGQEELGARIVSLLTGGADAWGGDFVAINARHQSCLQRALAAMEAAMAEFNQGAAPEFVALDLRAALDAVGEVVGKVDAEELLGEIFARFCIGK